MIEGLFLRPIPGGFFIFFLSNLLMDQDLLLESVGFILSTGRL